MTENQQIQTQLLADLQGVCVRLGRAPAGSEFPKFGLKSVTYYRYQFGSVEEALKQIGFRPNPSGVRFDSGQHGPLSRYTKRQIVNHLKRVAAKVGRTPTQRDLVEHGPPYPRTIAKYFDGKLSEAMKHSGLEARRGPRDRAYTDDELIDHIRKLEWKLGRRPTFSDLKDAGPPVVHTYIRRYGSFDNAMLAAGYVIRRPKERVNEQSV